jgi:hypothetical protein
MGSAYEVSYGDLRTMDEHVDGGSNQMKWQKRFKIIQTKRA